MGFHEELAELTPAGDFLFSLVMVDRLLAVARQEGVETLEVPTRILDELWEMAQGGHLPSPEAAERARLLSESDAPDLDSPSRWRFELDLFDALDALLGSLTRSSERAGLRVSRQCRNVPWANARSRLPRSTIEAVESSPEVQRELDVQAELVGRLRDLPRDLGDAATAARCWVDQNPLTPA
ncbi:MAG: DUF416 family protein [Myxococcales bacterium]|nr:DUF416 family protein [Myxococcales bacterium]